MKTKVIQRHCPISVVQPSPVWTYGDLFASFSPASADLHDRRTKAQRVGRLVYVSVPCLRMEFFHHAPAAPRESISISRIKKDPPQTLWHSLLTCELDIDSGSTYQPQNQSTMCYLEDTYHTPCGHWGLKRNYMPCAAAQSHEGLTQGCWNSTTDGTATLSTRCPNCLRKPVEEDGQTHWKPFKDISDDALRILNDLIQQRRLAPQKGYPWSARLSLMGMDRRRSYRASP